MEVSKTKYKTLYSKGKFVTLTGESLGELVRESKFGEWAGGAEGNLHICSQPLGLQGNSDLWVPRGCLLELGAVVKH